MSMINRALFLLVLLASISGCNVGQQQTTEGSDNSTIQSSEPPERASPRAERESSVKTYGQMFSVRGDRGVRVLKFGEFDYFSPGQYSFGKRVLPRGGRLVGLHLEIKNTGNASGDMTWSKFELNDTKGREYKEIADFQEQLTVNDYAKNNLGYQDATSQLYPGEAVRIFKVFRVSPDAGVLSLNVNDTIFALEPESSAREQASSEYNEQPDVTSPSAEDKDIPNGKAQYYSASSGKTETIGVSIRERVNSEGHTVYDADWADGYKSTYVFWKNGVVEILSKDVAGKLDNTSGKHEEVGGGTVIVATSGSRTTFPDFQPREN